MPDQPLLAGIGQIAVPVLDLPRAVAFYQDVLGLKLLFQAPPGLAFFDCGGVRLLVERPSFPAFQHPSSVLYFRVEDIEQRAATLRSRGVEFIDQAHVTARMGALAVWMTFFRDGEGNTHALLEEKPA